MAINYRAITADKDDEKKKREAQSGKDTSQKTTQGTGTSRINNILRTAKAGMKTSGNGKANSGMIGRTAAQKQQTEKTTGGASTFKPLDLNNTQNNVLVNTMLGADTKRTWGEIQSTNQQVQQRSGADNALTRVLKQNRAREQARNAPVTEAQPIESGTKLGDVLTQGIPELDGGKADQQTAMQRAGQEAQQHTDTVQNALAAQDWREFAPNDGSKLAIKRPDDMSLMGDAKSGAEMLLGGIGQGLKLGNGQWQQRQDDVALTYDNADGIQSVQLEDQAGKPNPTAEDTRRSAIDRTLGIASSMTGADLHTELENGEARTAEAREYKKQAQEKWKGIQEAYVRDTPEYQAEKARIDTERADIDARLAEAEETIKTLAPDDARREEVQRYRRQLKAAQYQNGEESRTLLARQTAYEVDQGRLEGTVSDADRLQYGLSENIEGDGTFIGNAVAELEKHRFALASTGYRYAYGKLRDTARVIIANQAAAAGYDTVYDYIEEQEGAGRTWGDMAFSDAEQYDARAIDFGGDTMNWIQQAEQMVVSNGLDAAISHGTGGMSKWMMLALSVPGSFSDAYMDAVQYGASAQQAAAAGDATAVINGAMNAYGFDKIEETAGNLFNALGPAGRHMIPEGLKRFVQSPGMLAAMNTFTSALGEGFEEVGEDVTQGIVRRIVYDRTSDWTGESGIFDGAEMSRDFMGGFAMGGLMTTVMGLSCDPETASYQSAYGILERAAEGLPVDERIQRLSETVQGDMRKSERTPDAVDAHVDFWGARGLDVPQSLGEWRTAAEGAQKAQDSYNMARQRAATLYDQATAGQFDPVAPENLKIWQDTMQAMGTAELEYRTAAQHNVEARALYYMDEDMEMQGITAKHEAMEQITESVSTAISEAVADPESLNPERLKTEEVQGAIETARDAALTEQAAQGEVDAARLELDQADGPAAQLEAKARLDAAQVAADEAAVQNEAAREALKRTVRSQTDSDALMQQGREFAEAAGLRDARLDEWTNAELQARADELRPRLEAAQNEVDSAKGTKRKAAKGRLEGIQREIDTIEREIQIRQEVYGDIEYIPPHMRTPAEAEVQTDTETVTDTEPDVLTQTTQAETLPETEIERRPAIRITVNGQSIENTRYAAMTDAELDAEITARVQEMADAQTGTVQDARTMPADTGMDTETADAAIQAETTTGDVTLDDLRAEADRRATEQQTPTGERAAARQARLDALKKDITEIPEWTDADLRRQRRYLEQQARTLQYQIEGAEADSREMEQAQRQSRETAELLEQVKAEQLERRDIRRAETQKLMEETGEAVETLDEADDEKAKRNARIALNQQTGRDAVKKLADSRKNGLRITDTISLADAATIFTDATGMEGALEGETGDDVLKRNSRMREEWELRRANTQQAIEEMTQELNTVRQAISYAETTLGEAADVADIRAESSLRDRLDQARALRKRCDTEIAYLRAHAGDDILATLKSGKLPEQFMERILGFVDYSHMNKMGILSMHLNTPMRVFDDIFGENAPIMRAIYIDPITNAETERTKFQRQVIDDLNGLHLNKSESELVQLYGEGLLKAGQLEQEIIDRKLAERGEKLKSGDGTWKTEGDHAGSGATDAVNIGTENAAVQSEIRRIQYATDMFRSYYAQMWEGANDALVRNGYQGLGKIKNYFPHFDGDEGNLLQRAARKLGFSKEDSLPTSIDGTTDTFTPGHKYSGHTQTRTGSKTTFDALKGMQDYLDSMTQIMYQTDNVKRLRQLEGAIRQGEDAGTLAWRGKQSNDLGNIAKWLHEYANQLAGKKANIFFDRDLEGTIGRPVYKMMNTISGKRAAAQIAGNLSSALSNTVPIMEVTSKHGLYVLKGIANWMTEIATGETTMPESGFRERRHDLDKLDKTLGNRISKLFSKPFELIDTMATNIVVRTCYEANIAHGMDADTAMMAADSEAARMMADRSKGALPTAFGSKTFMAMMGQYQLETLNTFERLQKDAFRERGNVKEAKVKGVGHAVDYKMDTQSKLKGAGYLAIFSILAHMFNEGYKKLLGRDIALDPIQAGMDTAKTTQETGSAIQGMQAGWSTLKSNLPFISNDRIGTTTFQDAASALSATATTIGNLLEGKATDKELDDMFWNVMGYIPGGGQIKKTYQGTGALLQDGVFNKNGQLMYPVDSSDTWTKWQASLFGRNATEYAQKYWDEGRDPLSEDNTATYLKLVEEGMNPIDAYESLYAYQSAGKLYTKQATAEKNGDYETAARLAAQIDALTAQVDYTTLLNDATRADAGKPYMAMLETAWRETGNKAFVYDKYYYGKFTKDKVKYKFLPESMETLQQVYDAEFEKTMAAAEGEWDSMTDEERKSYYSKAQTSARSKAKQYGFDHDLGYVKTEDYESAGIQAPEDSEVKPETPTTWRNPLRDAGQWITEGVNPFEKGYEAAPSDGHTDADNGWNPIEQVMGLFGGGKQADAAAADTTTDAVTDSTTDTVTDGLEVLTGDEKKKSSSGSSRRSSRKSSSSHKSSGSSSGSAGSIDLGMINVTPTTTVQNPAYKTAFTSAFGADYTLPELGNSFTWAGKDYTLDESGTAQYRNLYDAYMDMYLSERQAEWDGADAAGKEQIARELDERARAAAQEHYASLKG